MGEIKTAEWYDRVYTTGANYAVPVDRQIWSQVWSRTAVLLPQDTLLVDVGCGLGQLWQVARDSGKRLSEVYGIDFSRVAISWAAVIAEKLDHNTTLIEENLETIEGLPTGDSYVFCEILEHLVNDIRLLKLVPSEALVILTVPSFDSDGHVRIFKTREEVEARYADVFSAYRMQVVFKSLGQVWYIMAGIRV